MHVLIRFPGSFLVAPSRISFTYCSIKSWLLSAILLDERFNRQTTLVLNLYDGHGSYRVYYQLGPSGIGRG